MLLVGRGFVISNQPKNPWRAWARLIEDLPRFQSLLQPTALKIAIKAKGRILFLDPGDVVAVHAEGNYDPR